MAGEAQVQEDVFLPSESTSHESRTNVRLFTDLLSC